MENDVDIVIVGAGVIGLAIAYELSKTFNNIYVVENIGILLEAGLFGGGLLRVGATYRM